MCSERRRACAFLRAESGNATISFVLWVPFVLGVLMLFADVSLIMFHRANAIRVIEDANRMRAIGELISDSAVEDRISALLVAGDRPLTQSVESRVVSTSVVSEVEVPITSIDVFGVFAAISPVQVLTIRSQQFLERMGG